MSNASEMQQTSKVLCVFELEPSGIAYASAQGRSIFKKYLTAHLKFTVYGHNHSRIHTFVPCSPPPPLVWGSPRLFFHSPISFLFLQVPCNNMKTLAQKIFRINEVKMNSTNMVDIFISSILLFIVLSNWVSQCQCSGWCQVTILTNWFCFTLHTYLLV